MTDIKAHTVQVLYEDEDMLAVSKPSDMIVNNADTSANFRTLQDWVNEREWGKKFLTEDDNRSEFVSRSGIVHRLDKETSGVLLIAKNEKSFIALQKQFKERTVKKTYLALCHGKLSEEGMISVPIGRLPWNRKRFGIVPDGKSATTEFKSISFFQNPDDKKEILTLVRLFPKTGRTHQIRVHLQYIGNAIYADPFYAGRKTSRNDRKRLPRHFLHAEKIQFLHPFSEKEMTIESALATDLKSLLESLTEVKL